MCSKLLGNGTEYERMPPLIEIDNYDNCFHDSHALYCTTQLRLVSDTPNDLMDLIANYSEWDITHYDHRKLYRGVCMTRSCNGRTEGESSDLEDYLEACLNESLYRDYKFKCKLLTPATCHSADEIIHLNFWDIFVAALCSLIIMINIIATLYDFYGTNKSKHRAVNMLLAFSILRNWSRLRQNDYRSKPPVDRLKGFDGIRAITMILLVIGHSFLPFILLVTNPRTVEEMYDNLLNHIFLNGAAVVQVYFLMSGILLSYNMQRSAEKNVMHWTMISSNIIKRWLRLTPPFAVLLAVTSTLLRFMGSGPIWQIFVMKEVEDCQRFWMWNFFYIANYKKGSQCMPHTWYLAVDMHLYCFGILIFVLITNRYWRKVVLAIAFLIGLLIPGLVTFFYDFRFFLRVSPNVMTHLFMEEPTFHYLYGPTQANISSFVIGMGTGVFIHNRQKSNWDVQKYKKFLPLYWASIPCCFGIILLNSINYLDGPPLPLYIRVLFQILIRPVTAALFAIIIVGMAFKFDNFYRSILEWDAWACIAKLSYAAYLLHIPLVRIFAGNSTSLFTFSKSLIVTSVGITTISFLAAVVIWILIEAPISQIVKICMETSQKETISAKKDVDRETCDEKL